MERQTENGHSNHYKPRMFPHGFLWGTATSSYQVEGGNTRADWFAWEQTGGKIADGTSSGRGVDHWNLWKQDFDLLQKSLHNNAYRFSVEWSRLEIEPGVWDEEAFSRYRLMLRDLKARGITVMLTLHHFTNPQWLFTRGGWETGYAVRRFGVFVEKVTEALGEYVDLWVTINEPMVYVLEGYLIAEWPPQKKSKLSAARVLWNMARAHRHAYRVIHAWGKRRQRNVMVGIANNVSSFHSYYKHRVFDQISVALIDRFTNHLFYTLTRMKTHDFLGLNYYFHVRLKSVRHLLRGFLFGGATEDRPVEFEKSDIGWELFPHGIFDVCVDLKGYKKPIYITENGLATDNDDKRLRSLIGYLVQLQHAIQAGADVRGYFHWSLLDNFEWAKGYQPKFGLIDVDRRTMKRTPRPSAEIYGLIAKDNAIEHDFLRFLGHGTRHILADWKRGNAGSEARGE